MNLRDLHGTYSGAGFRLSPEPLKSISVIRRRSFHTERHAIQMRADFTPYAPLVWDYPPYQPQIRAAPLSEYPYDHHTDEDADRQTAAASTKYPRQLGVSGAGRG